LTGLHSFLAHADGTGLHKIAIDTSGSHYFAKQPTWSPDGTRILFVMYLASNNEGQSDLFNEPCRQPPDAGHGHTGHRERPELGDAPAGNLMAAALRD